MRLYSVLILLSVSSFFTQLAYSLDAEYYDLIKLKIECRKSSNGDNGYSERIWFIATDYNLLGSSFWTSSDKKRGIGKKVFTGTWSKNGLIIHGKGSYTKHKSSWKFYFNSKGNITLIEHLKKGIEGYEGEGSWRKKCSFTLMDKLDLSTALQVDNYIFKLKTITNNFNATKKQKIKLETDNKKLESQISVLMKQNEQVSIANNSNLNTIKDLMEDLNRSRSSLTEETNKIVELEKLIENQKQIEETLDTKLSDNLAKQAKFIEDQKKDQKSLDSKVKENDALQTKIKELKQIIQNQNQNQKSLDAKIDESDSLQDKIIELENFIENQKNFIENQQQTQETMNLALNDLKSANGDLLKSLSEKEKSLSEKEQIIENQEKRINSLNTTAKKLADEEADLKKKELEQKQAEIKTKQEEEELAKLVKEEKINYAKFNALFELMGGDKQQKLANYIFNAGFNNSSDKDNTINVKVFNSNECIIGWEDQQNGYLKILWKNVDFDLIEYEDKKQFLELKLFSKNTKNVVIVDIKSQQMPENYQIVLEKQNLYPPKSTESYLNSLNIPLAETSKYEQYLLEGSLKKLITEICK